ncbi:hypothetical protein BJ508DRAFT_325503 [Ascobolus immersus RN42]|uniref:Uncharacterized protein n=1 Tax=Ascobolus immersus RN42 TaxID=1160509 RepID=A0A3N4I8T8_ASCIM|nr:hypothetical protein BJ508DRAFT_325503 [Ascobolus immersus RN42]
MSTQPPPNVSPAVPTDTSDHNQAGDPVRMPPLITEQTPETQNPPDSNPHQTPTDIVEKKKRAKLPRWIPYAFMFKDYDPAKDAAPTDGNEHNGGYNGKRFFYNINPMMPKELQDKLIQLETDRKDKPLVLYNPRLKTLTKQEFLDKPVHIANRIIMGIWPDSKGAKGMVSSLRASMDKYLMTQWGPEVHLGMASSWANFDSEVRTKVSYTLTTECHDRYGWPPALTKSVYENPIPDMHKQFLKKSAAWAENDQFSAEVLKATEDQGADRQDPPPQSAEAQPEATSPARPSPTKALEEVWVPKSAQSVSLTIKVNASQINQAVQAHSGSVTNTQMDNVGKLASMPPAPQPPAPQPHYHMPAPATTTRPMVITKPLSGTVTGGNGSQPPTPKRQLRVAEQGSAKKLRVTPTLTPQSSSETLADFQSPSGPPTMGSLTATMVGVQPTVANKKLYIRVKFNDSIIHTIRVYPGLTLAAVLSIMDVDDMSGVFIGRCSKDSESAAVILSEDTFPRMVRRLLKSNDVLVCYKMGSNTNTTDSDDDDFMGGLEEFGDLGVHSDTRMNEDDMADPTEAESHGFADDMDEQDDNHSEKTDSTVASEIPGSPEQAYNSYQHDIQVHNEEEPCEPIQEQDIPPIAARPGPSSRRVTPLPDLAQAAGATPRKEKPVKGGKKKANAIPAPATTNERPKRAAAAKKVEKFDNTPPQVVKQVEKQTVTQQGRKARAKETKPQNEAKNRLLAQLEN